MTQAIKPQFYLSQLHPSQQLSMLFCRHLPFCPLLIQLHTAAMTWGGNTNMYEVGTLIGQARAWCTGSWFGFI